MGRPNGAGNERGEIRFSFSSVFLKKDENVVENVSEELSLGFLHEFCLCVCGLEMRIVSLNWIFSGIHNGFGEGRLEFGLMKGGNGFGEMKLI